MSGASTSSTSAMEEPDVTHCSICLETYKEPKALPCLHTFCRTCLEQHCAGKDQNVPCPMCREPFVVPRGGITNLRNNFFIEQLLQLKQSKDVAQKKYPSNNNFCELCSLRESEVMCYCVVCEQHMCEECSASHTKIQLSHHVVPRYSEAYMQHSNKKIKLSINYCDQHPSEPNRLYCYDCKTLTCHRCFVGKHVKHNLTDVDEAAEVFRQDLKRDVDNISAYPLKKIEKIKQIEDDTDRLMERLATTESEISQKYDQLISLIQSHKNELMRKLNAYKKIILKQVETVKDEIETQSVIRESFNAYVLELMNTGTACDISRTFHDLHARAEALVKTQNEPDCHQLNRVEVKFKPSLSTSDSAKNFIGELVHRGKLQHVPAIGKFTQKLDFTKLLENLTVRHVMPGTGHGVSGITVLGGEVFVVRHKAQVYVYKSDDVTLKRNIAITGSNALIGLVSCSHYNCLYIGDSGQKIVYKYNVTKNVVTKWSVKGKCYTFSVTKGYNLLATLIDTKQIQEYTTHGILIREISLDSSIDQPVHCFQLSTDNYVVCHIGAQQHRVCIVNQSGRIIQSYGGPPGAGVGQLSNPRHLAVDTQDNVLVADYSNNRVKLLSPTLTYLTDIVIPVLPGHQLYDPYALHFDELNHRLYIGELTGGRLLVLNVKY